MWACTWTSTWAWTWTWTWTDTLPSLQSSNPSGLETFFNTLGAKLARASARSE